VSCNVTVVGDSESLMPYDGIGLDDLNDVKVCDSIEIPHINDLGDELEDLHKYMELYQT